MLMHINKLELQIEWDNDRKPVLERVIRTYINLERVSSIMFEPDGFDGYACIQCGVKEHWVTNEEAERILAEINSVTDAAPPAAATLPAADPGFLVHLTAMKLDSFYSKTACAIRRMWRCTSLENYSFNIFDHVDHRNTYKLFQDAGYDLFMDEMQPGDTLDWTSTPILVYLQNKDEFFNPVRVVHPVDGDELRPVRHLDDDLSDPEDDHG